MEEAGPPAISTADMYPLAQNKQLPSSWNPKDKGTYIGLGKNNMRLHYIGPGKSHKDSTSVRSNHPVPACCGLYYYEVKICGRGKEGGVSIGFGTSQSNLDKLPGWEKCSYGYHSDDGLMYNAGESVQSSALGVKAGPGDVIGCGIDFVKRSCFYTLNGASLGTAHSNLQNPIEIQYYLMVGLSAQSDAVEVNFGDRGFMFNMSATVENNRRKFSDKVTACQLPSSQHPQVVSGMQDMILSYLTTHGYVDTARSLAQATGKTVNEDPAFVKNRLEILELIRQGQISSVLTGINKNYTGLLASNRVLCYRLLCQQFIEMWRREDNGCSLKAVTPLFAEREQASTSSAASLSGGRSATGVSNDRSSSTAAVGGPSSSPRSVSSSSNGFGKHGASDMDVESSPSPLDVNPVADVSIDVDSSKDANDDEDMDVSQATSREASRSDDGSMSEKSVDSQSAARARNIPRHSSVTRATGSETNGNGSSGHEDEDSQRLPINDGPILLEGKELSPDKMLAKFLAFGSDLYKLGDQLDNSDGEDVAEVKRVFRDAFSLIAYEEESQIEGTALEYLMDQKLRDELALLVNSTLLKSRGLLSLSTLELAVRHQYYCIQKVADRSSDEVALLSVDELCS